jgi:hypothetical protein
MIGPEPPGHDATPDYCALCDEDFPDDDPPIWTTWGYMHQECVDSHDSAAHEPLEEND